MSYCQDVIKRASFLREGERFTGIISRTELFQKTHKDGKSLNVFIKARINSTEEENEFIDKYVYFCQISTDPKNGTFEEQFSNLTENFFEFFRCELTLAGYANSETTVGAFLEKLINDRPVIEYEQRRSKTGFLGPVAIRRIA